jgi:hypothetical protein
VESSGGGTNKLAAGSADALGAGPDVAVPSTQPPGGEAQSLTVAAAEITVVLENGEPRAVVQVGVEKFSVGDHVKLVSRDGEVRVTR